MCIRDSGQGIDRMRAGRLAVPCTNAGRDYPDSCLTIQRAAKNALSHGAATNVAGANEQNGLHCERAKKVKFTCGIVNGEVLFDTVGDTQKSIKW